MYLPVAGHPFLEFDDNNLITRNPIIQGSLSTVIAHGFSSYDPELYIPLTFISFHIDYVLWGLHSFGFNLTNILLHCLNVWLVFLVGARLLGRKTPAAIAAMLFAIHPLETQTILWASARKDTLSTLLFLLSWHGFLRWRQEDGKGWYRWSLGCFLCALLAKVTPIYLPVLLLANDILRGRRVSKKTVVELLPYVALSVLFGVIAIIGKTTVLGTAGIASLMLLAAKGALFYAEKLVWPTGLSLLHIQHSTPSLFSTEFLIPILFILGVCSAIAVLWRRHSMLGFCLLFFLVTLVPGSLNSEKNGFLYFASEQYAYVAGIGLFFFTGIIVEHLLLIGTNVRRGTLVFFAAALVALSIRTYQQTRTWSAEEGPFTQALLVDRDASLAANSLGAIAVRAGDLVTAQSFFQQAILATPSYTAPYTNIARIAVAKGKSEVAVGFYTAAMNEIRRKKFVGNDDADVAFLYARLLEDGGQKDKAFGVYQEMVLLTPHLAITHYNLGLKYEERNQLHEALIQYERAVALAPRSLQAKEHLARVQSVVQTTAQ